MAEAARWVPSRADRPHLRANGHAGAPSSRRGASCSRDPLLEPRAGVAGFQEPGNPPPAASRGPRRWNKARRAPGSRRFERGHRTGTRSNSHAAPTSPLHEARQPRRAGRSAAQRRPGPMVPRAVPCIPPLAPGSRPTLAQAYLVLDLGREPVGRALVEVGHDDSGAGKRLSSGPEVPSTWLPRSWPRGVAAPRDARSSFPWAVQESSGRDGGRGAVPRLLGRRRSRRGSQSAPESRTNCPPPPPPALQGLAGEPDQWRAAPSRLSREGAARPIEGRRAPRSLLARVPGPRPRPHATEARGEAAPPPGLARRGPPDRGSRPSPAPGGFPAAQRSGPLPGIRSGPAERREAHQGRPAADPPACFGRLPGCRPGARRWQAGSLHPQRETPGAGLEALCPRKGVVGGGGRSRGTCFCP